MDRQSHDFITLKRIKYAMEAYIDDGIFDVIEFKVDADIKSWGERTARIFKEMMVQEISNSGIEYPADWKEAFKERWFPDWIKKKYPVKYKKYDAYMIFPDFLKNHPLKDERWYLNYDFKGGKNE